MNDPNDHPVDPSTPPAGFTDEVIQAIIYRIRNDDGRRHYLSTRRPEGSEEESQ